MVRLRSAARHAFNHHGAIEAFRAAEAQDPECAMCVWGEAWAIGSDHQLRHFARGCRDRARPRGQSFRPRHQRNTEGARAPQCDAPALRRRRPRAERQGFCQCHGRCCQGEPAGQRDRYSDGGRVHDHGELRRQPPRARACQGASASGPRAQRKRHRRHSLLHPRDRGGLGHRKKRSPMRGASGPLRPPPAHLVHMPSHTFFPAGPLCRRRGGERQRRDGGRGLCRARAGLTTADDVDYHLHNVHFGTISAIVSGDHEIGACPRRQVARLPPSTNPWYQIASSAAYFAYGRLANPSARRR